MRGESKGNEWSTEREGRKVKQRKSGGDELLKVNMTKKCLQSVRKCDSEGLSVQTRETSSQWWGAPGKLKPSHTSTVI